MERYDFDELTDRRSTNSYKWDSAEYPDLLPMWVADMDFRTYPGVTEVLKKRVEQGIFGYTRVPDSYYRAIDKWFSERYGWSIPAEQVIYTIGVVPAVSATLKAITEPGDEVILHTPAFNCFFSSIRNDGLKLLDSPLVSDGNTYRINFEELETLAARKSAKTLILCNPHNPGGRTWTPEELSKVADICARHNVVVVSDEIHCDLQMPGQRHTPFATIARESGVKWVALVSPSKSFNLAGLQIANIVCPDAEMRGKIDKAININEVCDVNPFGVIALQEAYNHGGEWLDSLREYIHGNYLYMKQYCAEHLPEFRIWQLESTYLAWMDCSSLGLTSEQIEKTLILQTGLWISAGTKYGAAGEGFMRWNLATQRSRLADALDRFRRFANNPKLL